MCLSLRVMNTYAQMKIMVFTAKTSFAQLLTFSFFLFLSSQVRLVSLFFLASIVPCLTAKQCKQFTIIVLGFQEILIYYAIQICISNSSLASLDIAEIYISCSVRKCK